MQFWGLNAFVFLIIMYFHLSCFNFSISGLKQRGFSGISVLFKMQKGEKNVLFACFQ